MKKQILFIAATAMCISNTLILTASPAQARYHEPQSQRFHFGLNYYPTDGATGRRSQPQQQLPTTSVTQGAVPSATSILGFNPKFLAQNTSTVSSNITLPPPTAPRTQPAPAYSNQFGQPSTPAALAPTAKLPPPGPTQSTSNRVGGKLLTRIPTTQHHSSTPRTTKPQHRSSSPPVVAKYGESLYAPGPTKPSSSELQSTREVNGKLLLKNSR